MHFPLHLMLTVLAVLQIVCISWVTICLQILTLVAFTLSYAFEDITLSSFKNANRWRADCRCLCVMLVAMKDPSHFTHFSCVCSRVDRCHYFHDSMLLHSTKQTSYVCSAKLSKRLPLWSNAKHCAECPPLKHFRSTMSETAARFGVIDEDAAVYLDFWSDRHEKLGGYDALRQSLHDVNGPFQASCSASRKTNANDLAGRCMLPSRLRTFSYADNTLQSRATTVANVHACTLHAGVDGSDYCVDCFGNKCTRRSASYCALWCTL